MQRLGHCPVAALALSLAISILPGCAPPAGAPGPEGSPVTAQPAPRTMQLLQAELQRVLATRGIELDSAGRPLKAVSSVPKLVYRQPGWFNDFNGDTSLAWIHYQQGDYDQNGEVNISDLTPVGIHLGKNSSSPDWLTAALIADGDGNGEINIADVTPIGQNFGARVAGYMVEAREATGEWREVGFSPMQSGVKSGPALEMGHFVYGGVVEADYRVAPVGGPREFSWNIYDVTSQPFQHIGVELAIVDGKPVLAYQRVGSTPDAIDGFAMSAARRPLSGTDWFVETDLGQAVSDFNIPALASVAGRPALAYVDISAAPVSYGLMYSRRDNAIVGPSAWTTHQVASFSTQPDKLSLLVREGRPAILLNNSGLEMYQALIASPTGPTDWTSFGAGPVLADFRDVTGLASGPWLFSAGLVVTPGNYVVFNRSTVPAPNGSGSFSEYLLAPLDWSSGPSMILIAGLPCIAVADHGSSSVQFLQAGSRTVDSAGQWFQHAAVSAPATDFFWNPELQLVGGRPAIACGNITLDFHWTGGQFPDNTAKWSNERVDAECEPYGFSMISIDGLPIIAFLSGSSGQSQVAVAVAQEQ